MSLTLSSHEMEANIHDYSHDQLRTALKKNIALRRYSSLVFIDVIFIILLLVSGGLFFQMLTVGFLDRPGG